MGEGERADGRARVQKILESAAPAAARLLAARVRDKKLDEKERYGAAVEILNRLYGKAPVAAGEEKEAGGEIEIRFSKDAEKYAE